MSSKAIKNDNHYELGRAYARPFLSGETKFAPSNYKRDDPRIELIIGLVSGGADSVLKQWIMCGVSISTEQMGRKLSLWNFQLHEQHVNVRITTTYTALSLMDSKVYLFCLTKCMICFRRVWQWTHLLIEHRSVHKSLSKKFNDNLHYIFFMLNCRSEFSFVWRRSPYSFGWFPKKAASCWLTASASSSWSQCDAFL